jgi:histidyl-tRNA synthetase
MPPMRFQAPRGTEDILPGASEHWAWLEHEFRKVCDLYGFREIRTPTFEETALFERLGEGADVSKQMYTFTDKGGRSITLKPEGTAPAIRAVIEHTLVVAGQITKLWYVTPVFRYERPQKGRLRESHQFGLELLGSAEPDADAEVIDATVRFYRTVGLESVAVKLNTLGDAECRGKYRDALLEFARPALADLPQEFRERCERNPLRILDSKDETLIAAMKDAPVITAFLEDASRDHFEQLQERLDALGIEVELAPRLVRGLDYYTKTVFEVHSGDLGAQSALCGGGRYDGLMAECGGHDTPAVGVGIGLERALLALEAAAKLPASSAQPDVFAICLTENRNEFARIVSGLRSAGIRVETDLQFRSAKSQFRQADRSGAKFALVIGDEELIAESATVKDLADGTETKVPIANLNGYLSPRT